MSQPVSTLLACTLLLAPGFLLAQGKGPAAAVAAETYAVKTTPMASTVTTVGTLRANESVDIVPELTKRLVKVEVQEGAQVSKDEVLFILDDADLTAEISEIDARLKLAEANETRTGSLLPERAISKQAYDLAKAELDIFKAQKVTREVELAKTRIRAPFAGKTGVRRVSEGALVTPTTVLMSLQDLSRIKVDFPLPERYAAEVKPGQKFSFTVAGNATRFEGKVQVIEPAVEAATRSLHVRGVCEQPKGLLPGGFADVTLDLDTVENGFAIPSQAVVPSAKGQGVYVLKDGKAEFRDVEIGLRTAGQVQVLHGLAEGDQVLTTNLLRLRPGVEVTPLTP
ncbi:efflux RND transporter periplasmic adaptor subunit [Luteolibacter sp. GHJ8]|uniref:Efflux RND transporter periplasmic adaptor subunit n=1 Tax=Luteolibacter rhizosphaerae TaxID=2989719 RepID=A0ABT3G100_9BACT|nr:efflux RND transporter periplasmic adaptor subunit [Luteolibacter rhizosphaerae]MCW1913522.1 efflux RND transporter periplasmic adaptor subunit [Luteolibacter rhizosphaerae]